MAPADGLDDESKVIIDLGASTELPVGNLPTAAERQGGPWLVIAAYVIAATALALAIYERFGA